jgi:hypothetical protein
MLHYKRQEHLQGNKMHQASRLYCFVPIRTTEAPGSNVGPGICYPLRFCGLRFFLSFFLSFSLSHTHTHTC